jgi:hypothetical protein
VKVPDKFFVIVHAIFHLPRDEREWETRQQNGEIEHGCEGGSHERNEA